MWLCVGLHSLCGDLVGINHRHVKISGVFFWMLYSESAVYHMHFVLIYFPVSMDACCFHECSKIHVWYVLFSCRLNQYYVLAVVLIRGILSLDIALWCPLKSTVFRYPYILKHCYVNNCGCLHSFRLSMFNLVVVIWMTFLIVLVAWANLFASINGCLMFSWMLQDILAKKKK